MSSQPKFNLTCSADCFSFSPTGNGRTFGVYSTITFYISFLPLKLMGDVISLDLWAAFCKASPFKLFLTLEYLIFFIPIPNSPSFLASTLLFCVLGVRAHTLLSSQCILPVPEAIISHRSHPCSLHIIQLHLWHHHWPPRGHPNFTAFRTDLILLLPNLVSHPDAAVHLGDCLWLLILFRLQHPISDHRHIPHDLQAACLPNVPTSLNSSFHRHPREHHLLWPAPAGLSHPPLLLPVTQPLSSQSSL